MTSVINFKEPNPSIRLGSRSYPIYLVSASDSQRQTGFHEEPVCISKYFVCLYICLSSLIKSKQARKQSLYTKPVFTRFIDQQYRVCLFEYISMRKGQNMAVTLRQL